jgi:hypothetical protein
MNIEQKRANYDKWFKIGLVALAALLLSPIIFLVVKGIVGLALAAGIGLIIVNLAPVFSMKLANWKVKGIIAEAKENPIETMICLLASKKLAFKTFKDSVEVAITASKTFELKCKAFAQQYPARAREFDNQLTVMQALVERKKIALKDAQNMLIEGENKLTEMRMYYDMAEAANAANKATGMDTGDIYAQLKSDTACDAVFESMNRVFSQLEVESALALENNPSPALNIVDVKVKAVV